MTSRKSFLASMQENNKRRVWVFILSALVWFFYYPVGMALIISRAKSDFLWQTEQGLVSGITQGEFLKEAAAQWLSFQEPLLVLVSLLALIGAIQGFSFLYSRKKVDLYYSVPVKKTRRFFVIWLNGVLIYLVPMLLCLLLSLAVAAVNGAVSPEAFFTAVLTACMNLALFLATYSLIILAVMLTGNLIITLLASGVFLFYEVALKGLFFFCKGEFFRYYSYRTPETSTVLSPAGYYIRALEKVRALPADLGFFDAWAACLPAILLNLLMALVFGLIGFYCYKKRPSEAADRSMAFPGTKAAVKLLLVIPAALAAGMVVRDVVGSNETPGNVALLIFTLAAAVLLGCGIMEVIYERDIRAALHKKRQILIAGAGVALLYCVFRFDLTGFDRWEPDPADLKDAVVIINSVAYQQGCYNEDMTWAKDQTDYYLSRPGIGNAQAVCDLTRARVPETEADEAYAAVEVAYRMKNGGIKWRSFQVPVKEEEALNRIMDDQAFRQTFYSWYNDSFFEGFLKLPGKELVFDSGIALLNLAPQDMETVRALYLQDMGDRLFSTISQEYVCGRIGFSARNNRQETVDFTLDLYPSCTNTIGWLKEKGLWQAGELSPETVESITVTNYHNELSRPVYYNSPEAYLRRSDSYATQDYEVTKTFKAPEQIKELIKALYPSRFPQTFKQGVSSDYYATVRLKESASDAGQSSAYYRGSDGFTLITDRIPEFLEAETAYK